MTERRSRLALRYLPSPEEHVLYGAVYVDNQPLSHPYIISEQFGDVEITRGSVLSLLDKIVRQAQELEHRFNFRQQEVETRKLAGLFPQQRIGQPTAADFHLHHQANVAEDILLVLVSHYRTLDELFSGKLKRKLTVYDIRNQPAGKIDLHSFAAALAHHRYLVIHDEAICDVMSSKLTLPSERLVGSRVKVLDFFNAVLNCAYSITVNDFVGLLHRQFLNALESTEPRANDIVFLMQNVHSLSRVTEDRRFLMSDKLVEISEILLEPALRRDNTRANLDGYTERDERLVAHTIATPGFKLDEDISKRQFLITVSIDDVLNVVRVDFEKFLSALSKACGDEPLLMPIHGYASRAVNVIGPPSPMQNRSTPASQETLRNPER